MKIITFIYVLPLIFFISCGEKKPEIIEEEKEIIFDRLIGTWKLVSDDEDQYESWIKNNDNTFSSTVFVVSGKDTTVSEKIKIYPRDGKWDFETIVTGQNKGKPVDFLSTHLNDSLVQFENLNHDFPKLINYTLQSEMNLRAFIAGKTDTIYFHYTRVNKPI